MNAADGNNAIDVKLAYETSKHAPYLSPNGNAASDAYWKTWVDGIIDLRDD